MKKKQTRQFRLGSFKINYDIVSFIKDKNEAKECYENQTYLGSGSIYYINGVEKRHPHKLHFFKFKAKSK